METNKMETRDIFSAFDEHVSADGIVYAGAVSL